MQYIETLKKQDISISLAGDNVVIAPGMGEMPAAWNQTGTYLAIDFISFVPTAGVVVQFKSGQASGEGVQSNYGGAMTLATAQTLTWENAMHNEHGVITLNPGQSFVINLSAPVQISGMIRYRLINDY